MSNEGTNSDISQSGTGASCELRYKKALKEISRLVAMNTTLKKQNQNLKDNFNKLQQQYSRLNQSYSQMMTTPQSHAPVTPIFHNNNDGKFPGPVSEKPGRFVSQQLNFPQSYLNNNLPLNMPREAYSQQYDLSAQEEIRGLKQRLLYFEQTLQEKNDIIVELQTTLENKHLEIIKLEDRYGDLNEKMIKSQTVLQEAKQSQESVIRQLGQELVAERKRVQEIEVKLLRSEQWAAQLTGQCENLKKQLMFTSRSNNPQPIIRTSTTSLHIPNILYSSFEPSDRIRRMGSNLHQQRGSNQIERLRLQFQGKKNKYKAQIRKLKEQVQQLRKQIDLRTQFIVKQQYYIENYVRGKEQILIVDRNNL